MKRRDFITNGALAAVGATLINPFDALKRHHGHIGVQLWSVRDAMKTDAKGTLQKLARYGYKEVECGNYQAGKFYGFSPKEFRTMLDDAGLKMVSGHAATLAKYYDAKTGISDDWKVACEAAKVAGQTYIINPYMNEPDRKTADTVKHMVDTYNAAGQYANSQGLKYAYHNHDFEFK